MNDLISKQDAIEIIRNRIEKSEVGESIDHDQVISDIESFPSAEPRTGEWIKATGMMPPEFHGHHCCSECGNFANMEPPFGNREDLSDFCPNCGVRMKGADDETD